MYNFSMEHLPKLPICRIWDQHCDIGLRSHQYWNYWFQFQLVQGTYKIKLMKVKRVDFGDPLIQKF
jgi:hypothetical protein